MLVRGRPGPAGPTRWPGESLLSVDVPAIANVQDCYVAFAVVDFVNHPVVAHTKPKPISTFQFETTRRSRIFRKRGDGVANPCIVVPT